MVCTKTLYNIETREKFEHLELDTIRGSKDKIDLVLVSLLECISRLYVVLRCPLTQATDVKETATYMIKYV